MNADVRLHRLRAELIKIMKYILFIIIQFFALYERLNVDFAIKERQQK